MVGRSLEKDGASLGVSAMIANIQTNCPIFGGPIGSKWTFQYDMKIFRLSASTCFYTPAGIVDWQAGRLLPPDTTAVEGVRRIFTPWDRTMEAWVRTGSGPTPCPRFEAMVTDIFGDDAVAVRTFQ